MTDETTILPRQILCALGAWTDLDVLEATLPGGFSLDRAESRLEPDPRMEKAFAASADRVVPSMSDEDLSAIRDHAAVAYILCPRLTPSMARASAATTLALVKRLFEAGAVAIKSESGGIAHGRARWLELAQMSAADDPFDAALALYFAFVRRPLLAKPVYHSCGMHLLGEPDVEIEDRERVLEALDWIDTLAAYLLTEKPTDGVEDGHTFRRTEKDKRRVLRSHPCVRYERDDLFFNPYGYLRIEKVRRKGR